MINTIPSIVSFIIGLQFAFFGWRINREITVGDKTEKTWIPFVDKLNILNIFLTIILCVLTPIYIEKFSLISKTWLIISASLIMFHPINMMAHYELLWGEGRSKYKKKIGDLDFANLPSFPTQEKITTSLSIIISTLFGLLKYIFI